MASTQHIDNEFSAQFFADIFRLYPQFSRQYRCTDISDIHYCQLGVLRCLSSSATGQEFLQFHADQGIANIDSNHFFKTLKSPRRLANITSLNDLLAGPMKQSIPDPYAQCPELDDWDLHAVDGLYHQAACFDKKSISSKGELRAIASGHFFRMNMRNHHMSCLGMANPEDGATYTYLTNDNTLPAYQIVLLYKHRWDIEKIFHQFKSKMGERKSWASSLEAKQSHAMFECLTHNLLLLFEQYLGYSEGLREELEEKKQQGRARSTAVASLAAGIIRSVGNFINTALDRATQRTQRFIRWVRVDLQTDSLEPFHRPPQADLGHNMGFHTDRVIDWKRQNQLRFCLRGWRVV